LWVNGRMVEIADEIVVVSVTKKGQATIPKKLRQKYGIKDKAIIMEDQKGILLKPLPSPVEAFGSLKHLYPGKTAREVIEEGRKEDCEREKRLLKIGISDV
jgi:antitoxin PrlF